MAMRQPRRFPIAESAVPALGRFACLELLSGPGRVRATEEEIELQRNF
jgi:hypothetical protein